MNTPSEHFKGKTAVDHVIEAQAKGLIAASEIHGTETPGSIAGATDSARNTTIALLLLYILLHHWSFPIPLHLIGVIFVFFGFGWLFWSVGRSAWLGWSRLERLHRILEEERWEIEHNRAQERDELKALYRAKGFEGQLLEDVMDVLMADGDRLLRVMIEEELGLSLEVNEHPLKQALGAGLGVIVACMLCLLGLWIWPAGGLYISALIIFIISSAISAHYEGNRLIPAIVWNIGIAVLAVGSAKFFLNFISTLSRLG